jgi:hypothetical protein
MPKNNIMVPEREAKCKGKGKSKHKDRGLF